MTTARPEPAPRPLPGDAPELRLSVWSTAQRDARTQRRGRYLPASTAHPAKMLPAIAATAVARYTEPGDLVADPMCGIGTTLVEAVHLGRDGLGIEYEDRWASLAAANVDRARRQGAAGNAEVIRGDARLLPGLLPPGTAGRAALVVTSPPYGPSVHGQVVAEQRRGTEGGVRKYDNRYGHDPANLASQGLDELLAGFTEILSGCAVLLRPGGLAVVTARPWRQHGELVDLPAAVIAAGARAGLVPVARCVALLAGLRGGRLIARPSFFQLDNLRRARRQGHPWHLIVHEDVLIFRNPPFPGGSHALKAPPREAGSPARPPCDVDAEGAGGLGAAALCADLDSTREAPRCSKPGQRQRGQAARGTCPCGCRHVSLSRRAGWRPPGPR
jgi:modification methylase